MSFLYSIGGLWNTAVSCFPGTAKYCQDNNISWSTTSHLARELATITVWGPLSAAQEAGKATAAAAVGSVANAVPTWVYSVKDMLLHTASRMLLDKAAEFQRTLACMEDRLEGMCAAYVQGDDAPMPFSAPNSANSAVPPYRGMQRHHSDDSEYSGAVSDIADLGDFAGMTDSDDEEDLPAWQELAAEAAPQHCPQAVLLGCTTGTEVAASSW